MDYFYHQQSEMFAFYRIPRLLMTHERFKDMSCDAKLLYGVLLARMELSQKNNWLDKNGRVFVYYSIENIMEALGCAHGKAGRLLKELVDCGLLEKKRQGLGAAGPALSEEHFYTGSTLNPESRFSAFWKSQKRMLNRKSRVIYYYAEKKNN